MTQSLDEIVGCVERARLRDGLIDGQEDLERYPVVGFQLVGALFHVGLRGILAQCSQALPHLVQLDLAIATVVKQVKRLLEL